MIIDWKNKVLHNLQEGTNISIISAQNIGDENYDITVLLSGKKYKYYGVPEATYHKANELMKKGTGFAGLNLLKKYELKGEIADEETAKQFFDNMRKRFS